MSTETQDHAHFAIDLREKLEAVDDQLWRLEMAGVKARRYFSDDIEDEFRTRSRSGDGDQHNNKEITK